MAKKTELLAPAKDKETAFAAIDCGADAVYIGAPAFGARKNAPNSLDDIKEVIDYAHKYWARVHITVNTILTDNELDDAVQMIFKLAEMGADAFIVQDMGIIEKLMPEFEKRKLPPIHMSTQCDNYLSQKIKFFNDIGVSRVILAREVSIEQIKDFHKNNPNLELENFIHGALCVSMSGQCYLSYNIGGRSANRGECAQPCRKKYDVISDSGENIAKNIYPLCLKDFNGSGCINELVDAGITSFKIEGRLKDINYVKNVVAYYRTLLTNKSSSGKSTYQFIPNPEKSFNRGFTEYFLKGRENCFSLDSPKSKGEFLGKVVSVNKDYFTISTDKELHSQDGLYFNGDGCLVNKAVKQNNVTHIYPNKKIDINNGDKIFRNIDVEFEKELSKPVKRQIGLNINVENNVIDLIDEDGVSLSYKIEVHETAKDSKKMNETFVKQFSKTGESDFYIKKIKINSELPFLPISEINKLRRDLFELLMSKRIKVYNENRLYQRPLKYTKYYLDEVDYKANIYNNFAKKFYEKCGVKVLEPALEKNIPNRQIELMRCKHCIKYALNMCKSKTNLLLRDEKGKTYPLKFDCKNCTMYVMSN